MSHVARDVTADGRTRALIVHPARVSPRTPLETYLTYRIYAANIGRATEENRPPLA